jgi:triacylglycerol lipase
MKKILLFVLICFFVVYGHTPAEIAPITENTLTQNIITKYPVVLVHGIARNDNNRHVNPWGRISNVLRDNGVRVYYGETDAWGTILSNAELLKTTINTLIEEKGYEKVNIIAHSKGGIDSRFCIWKYDLGDRVASLTTIATPHHGSEIADLVFNTRVIHRNFVKRMLGIIGRLYGDVNPNMYNVNSDLTTENMREFNAIITKDHRVYYQSIVVILRHYYDDPIFFFSNDYIKNIGYENDGLVSEKSASWGINVVELPGSISHEQIIDRGMRRIHGMEIPNIYLGIVSELGRMGF